MLVTFQHVVVGVPLEQRAASMEGKARLFIQRCMDATVQSLEANVPKDTLRLQRAITTRAGPERRAIGWWGAVGPYSKLGDPSQPAPRGTIKKFLRWYRMAEPTVGSKRWRRLHMGAYR